MIFLKNNQTEILRAYRVLNIKIKTESFKKRKIQLTIRMKMDIEHN